MEIDYDSLTIGKTKKQPLHNERLISQGLRNFIQKMLQKE